MIGWNNAIKGGYVFLKNCSPGAPLIFHMFGMITRIGKNLSGFRWKQENERVFGINA